MYPALRYYGVRIGGLHPSGLAVEGPTYPRGKGARFLYETNASPSHVFSAKTDTIIRRLRLLQRAKRKWHAAGSGTARSATPLL